MRARDSQVFTVFGRAYFEESRGDRFLQEPKKGLTGKIAALLGVLLIGIIDRRCGHGNKQPELFARGIRRSDAADDPLHRQASRHRRIRRSPLLTEQPFLQARARPS